MDLEKKLAKLVEAAYKAYTKKAEPDEKLRELIRDHDTPATVLLIGCRRLLGSGFLAWEPETLWLELGDVPAVNRDKILAAIALAVHPSFYWDAGVMGHTILALNDEAVYAADVPRPSVEALSWGVFEAELIFGITDEGSTVPHFDDTVAAYVAVVLHAEGWAYPPENLDFADDVLKDLLSPIGVKLRKEVKEAWRGKPAESYDETPLGIQLARQAQVIHYMDHRLDRLETALSRL